MLFKYLGLFILVIIGVISLWTFLYQNGTYNNIMDDYELVTLAGKR